jgi:hypothetical protein
MKTAAERLRELEALARPTGGVSYAEASRERFRLMEALGRRAFAAMWDENCWPDWSKQVIDERGLKTR